MIEPEPPAANRDSHAIKTARDVVRSLNGRYALVLALVACLGIVDQAVIQPLLVQLNFYAPVINIAGRQRMLSQRLTKSALALQQAHSREEIDASRNELSDTLQQWTKAHHGLVEGDSAMNLPGTDSQVILASLAELEQDYVAMQQAAQRLVALSATDESRDRNSGAITDSVEEILQHERNYLPVMDEIVGLYEAESRSQVTWLRNCELTVMLSVLALLASLGIGVLRPAQRVIREQVEELSARQKRYRLLVEQMSDGLVIYDSSGRISYANGRFCQMLGIADMKIKGTELLTFASSGQQDILAETFAPETLIAAHNEDGDTDSALHPTDVIWRRADGSELATMVCANVCTQRDASAAPSFFAVITDISDRKRAEELLRENRDELEKRVQQRTTELTTANQELRQEMQQRRAAESRTQQLQQQLAHASRVTAIGQLATGLAHELNQPMSAITNYSESCELLLERDTPDVSRIQFLLAGISRSALRAGEIIRRMRNYLRNGSDTRTEVDASSLLKEVEELCQAEVRRGNIDFTITLGEVLPRICVDTIQIQQVLVNLIQNSIQAMSEVPRSKRRLEVAVQRAGDVLEFWVGDTGPGLPSSSQEDIFTPFYTTKSDGLGMGLAISRSIIHRHGGRLWAENRSTGGAVVQFTLPVESRSNAGMDAYAESVCS